MMAMASKLMQVHVPPENTKKVELRNYLKNKELLMFKNNKVENYADNWCSDALEFLKHLISGKLMAANGSRCIGMIEQIPPESFHPAYNNTTELFRNSVSDICLYIIRNCCKSD